MSGILSVIEQDKRQQPSATSALGTRGETLAASFLVSSGYRIVVSNFKVPVGRNSKGAQVTGEIDIVALDADVLCFVEVKTRRSDDLVPVIAAVDRRKQRQITRTARVYRRVFGLTDVPHRFDVVTVVWAKHAEPAVELIKGFWNEGDFRKHRWRSETWNEFA